MEFYDVNFSYIDLDTMGEEFVSIPEQDSGLLIPEWLGKVGYIYCWSQWFWNDGYIYIIEKEVVYGRRKFERTGVGSCREAKEIIETSLRYFKANSRNICASIFTTSKDYLMHVQDINGVGMTSSLSLVAIIAMCSRSLNKPVQSQLAVLVSVSIGGTINKVEDLTNILQVCFDAGAKKILLSIVNAADISTVSPELFTKFQIMFYLGVE